jgi:hypothetical protein
MELDRIASEIVLSSLRHAVPSRWSAKVEELRGHAKGADVPLSGFLEASGLELEDVYAGGKSWSDLCEDAGLPSKPSGPHEASLRKACGRLLHVDDQARLDAYRAFLNRGDPPDPARLSPRERRVLRMLIASLVDKAATKSTTLAEGCALVWAHPQVRQELLTLLDALETRIAHLPTTLSTHPEVPLAVHARYTRLEILAAFGAGTGAKVAPWQSGVYWASEARADLLAFTLDKTSGHFSPTTRYRDYAIRRDLIHWESQSVTRADSDTGRRYQRHAREGTSIMLFARQRTDDRAFYFLGPATYVKHQGELPMAVTWKLAHPLPGDLFAAFAAAVA